MPALPAISAHRGGAEIAPSQTWEAYRSALGTGAEYVEFDVRKTADGVLVAYHDEVVAGSGRRVLDLSYQQLCDLLGRPVPLVGEVMELVSGRAVGHVDLKEAGYEDEVVSLASDVFGPGGFVVSTQEDRSVVAIRKRHPRVRTALSLGRGLRRQPLPLPDKARIRHSELFALRRIRDCGADWVAVHHWLARLTVLRLCHRLRIRTMVWTVNHYGLMRTLLADRRVDVLVTDHPQRAVAVRAALFR